MTNPTRAVFLTAYNRPDLLARVLDSWSRVRGRESWMFLASIEPGPCQREIEDLCYQFFLGRPDLPSAVLGNPERYGVLHHPWVRFDYLFDLGYDFVVRAEDDLLVSDDTLEYLSWAEAVFRNDQSVATVHAYSDDVSTDPGYVHTAPKFNPLVWGTWQDRWRGFMRDTWDHDYSTFNGQAGNQSGWDWNLNTRLFPALGLRGVYPRMSRVDNIGVHGTHSTPENFYTAPSFRSEYGHPVYELA